jgi:hypothetical protein
MRGFERKLTPFGRVAMDFIERLFGVSPDGGNGSLEALYLIAAVIVVSLGWTLWRRRRAS